MTALGLKFSTYRALGFASLARVGAYRLALRVGLHPVQNLRGTAPEGPFFVLRPPFAPEGAKARDDWKRDGPWFGKHAFSTTSPPDWHTNPFSGARANSLRDWFEIDDFDSSVGDIKTVWEASRFDWLIAMAQRAAMGDVSELDRLNTWLADWAKQNPPYYGANWKCGQEASIRVMHLALAALILDQVENAAKELVALVKLHLARIAPTIAYAIGQQNNHGTSEAGALFIGGSWLAMTGDRDGVGWAKTGRKWLEERAKTLVAADGTFSQYSLVYHRVMLDTYSLTESWRRRFGMAEFHPQLLGRLAAATRWLQQMVDPRTGDGPNLGANDGARLMALTDTDYRDFRPSLQWAGALFLGARAFCDEGAWDQPLLWLGLTPPTAVLPEPVSATFDNGGLHILRTDDAVAYLRYPRFAFRPSQSDLLHLDLWVQGENVLRDGGSYSYNSNDDKTATYFGGVASHNTAQFDGRDQMPRLDRFLFGAWPEAEKVAPVSFLNDHVHAAAGYSDHCGARHLRTVELSEKFLLCRDELSGNALKGVIRWRLCPGDWRLVGNRVEFGRYQLTVESNSPAMSVRLVDGSESRYYLQKSPLPVFEIDLPVPATVWTRIEF
jgi:Heparinase II/III-like protein/Heparinase II/III N-terminus